MVSQSINSSRTKYRDLSVACNRSKCSIIDLQNKDKSQYFGMTGSNKLFGYPTFCPRTTGEKRPPPPPRSHSLNTESSCAHSREIHELSMSKTIPSANTPYTTMRMSKTISTANTPYIIRANNNYCRQLFAGRLTNQKESILS